MTVEKRLAQTRAVVVGVGAVGRAVALQLTALGVSELCLIDPGMVGYADLGPRGYRTDQLHSSKVVATCQDCETQNPACSISEHVELFKKQHAENYVWGQCHKLLCVLFCCVNHQGSRTQVWTYAGWRASLWVDIRVRAAAVRVLTSDDPGEDVYYPGTLADKDQDGVADFPAVYHAAASLGMTQLSRFLSGAGVERDMGLDLVDMDLWCD